MIQMHWCSVEFIRRRLFLNEKESVQDATHEIISASSSQENRRQKTMTDMFELTLVVAGGLFVRTMSIRTLILEEENTRRTKNRLSNTAFPFSVLFSFFSQLQLLASIVILLSYG